MMYKTPEVRHTLYSTCKTLLQALIAVDCTVPVVFSVLAS